MNKYKIRSVLRDVRTKVMKNMNHELNPFNLSVNVTMTNHVADRILDRSLRQDIDIKNIEELLSNLGDHYLGYMMFRCRQDDENQVLLYKTYRNNFQECFALGVSMKFSEGVYDLVVRTFIPACRMSYLRERPNFEIKPPKNKVRLVSPLQKMLYSENCPEALRILR